MKWANFLHFYQPVNQQKDILEAVVDQCYRPLFKGLLENSRAVLTINVSGGLLQALDAHNFTDVIDDIRKLYETKRVEFTSTACYHAFLPLLPKDVIRRQVTLNNETLTKYLGSDCTPAGFFPPEMGYSRAVGEVAKEMGFKYLLLDEIACPGYSSSEQSESRSQTVVLFRQRMPSNLIMAGIERSSASLHLTLQKYATQPYLITAMDGETFGHHRPGLEKMFLDVFNNTEIEFVRLSDLLTQEPGKGSFATLRMTGKNQDPSLMNLRDSTWASSEEDIAQGIQFISWKDPSNQIHTWQWELVGLMLKVVGQKSILEADLALASDQFFWASAKPWWSVEMIESGAYAVLKVIEAVEKDGSSDVREKAQALYRQIVSTAFEWQRTGRIREMNRNRSNSQRIPFRERTNMNDRERAVFTAFIDMMKTQEKKAALSGEYEKAILWRDAVYKIMTKNDIYDGVNAVDLLRVEIGNEEVEKMLDKYTARFKEIRGGQPEQRSN